MTERAALAKYFICCLWSKGSKGQGQEHVWWVIALENPHPHQAGSGEKRLEPSPPDWQESQGLLPGQAGGMDQEGMWSLRHRSGSQQDAGLLPLSPLPRNLAAASHSCGNYVHPGSYIPGAKKQTEF